ncbi:prenylcysteine oxidase [Cephus cinctus]|uniref:Prenylcysteine oxidase n=1 Tax=Cephus cinctus TaxID=211228 RepID=A0AAJ7BHT9_CEPCN|nr:prenylcysteine oxidase [Cephus cinctus]XP_015586437.1 prenylcysteine oxidase [Cephus cinctus]XP_015586438.1 prenylcysteine oxidase [Cephus cinctus]XP_024936762.1 prenylcysteine oxidase [Cephus cinctus]XP_024936763.1 prenylcysteine oxidase [Cephus cinctus]
MNNMLYLLLLTFFINKAHSIKQCTPRIAIIGGGISGSSASYYLNELFKENVQIDVFEANNVGGRLATIEIGQNLYEAGGSIIHNRQRYMNHFTEILGLEQRPSPDNQRYGVWNGKEFVFKESKWEIITFIKLFYRYGFQPFALYSYINKLLQDFETIYELQNNGATFINTTSLMGAMNEQFPKMMDITTKNHLLNLGYSSKLIDELVTATLIVNYGQDTNVQSFVGCASVAGGGFNLWAVKGGNDKIPKGLISKTKSVEVVPSQVTKIRYSQKSDKLLQYEIFYDQEGISNSSFYDIVIIATPLTQDQEWSIEFEGFPNGTEFKFPGDYQTTVATFVQGDLNPSYFGLAELLDGVMSCNLLNTKINSIGKIFPVEGYTGADSRVWKIFSKESLKLEDLNDIFLQIDEVKEVKWKAYPHYGATLRNDNFKLYDLVYQTNAIEWAASAMEMSAIAGRNVAILAYNEYLQKYSSASSQKPSDKKVLKKIRLSEL